MFDELMDQCKAMNGAWFDHIETALTSIKVCFACLEFLVESLTQIIDALSRKLEHGLFSPTITSSSLSMAIALISNSQY